MLKPYRPLPMTKRVKIRNPADRPEADTNQFGQVVNQPDWGFSVWANVRDQAPFLDIEEGVEIIRGGRKVITIKWRRALANDAEILIHPDLDVVYKLVGQPTERGGANAGMFTRWLELHCERRDVGGEQP